jgi:hypothetical protein
MGKLPIQQVERGHPFLPERQPDTNRKGTYRFYRPNLTRAIVIISL